MSKKLGDEAGEKPESELAEAPEVRSALEVVEENGKVAEGAVEVARKAEGEFD